MSIRDIISMHLFCMMIIINKFQVIIYVGKIILSVLNDEVFVFATEFLFFECVWPSKGSDGFESFMTKLELNLDSVMLKNPFF